MISADSPVASCTVSPLVSTPTITSAWSGSAETVPSPTTVIVRLMSTMGAGVAAMGVGVLARACAAAPRVRAGRP